MDGTQRAGCLVAVFRLLGWEPQGETQVDVALPYRKRDGLLTAAELRFHEVLVRAVNGSLVVCPKVRLADIVFTVKNPRWQSFQNQIDRKHIDFLLCDPATLAIRCGVELDDSSHDRPERIRRDEFVERTFAVAGVPLVRFPVKASYAVETIISQLARVLVKPAEAPATVEASPAVATMCPSCQVPMVERTATKGPNKGRLFLGCPNYPRCRQTIST